MPADSRIAFRVYRAGDEDAILELFTRSFHAARTVAHFNWKYRDDPFGKERMSLAFDGSRLVAQYAAYPIPFWHEGRELVANHIADIMSDRSVRHIGRGESSVFAGVARHFYENFCAGRVAFNFGFNTATSREFSVRFTGATAVEPVPYRVRGNLAPIGRLRRWRSGYSLELVREPGPEYDELFRRVAPSYRFLVRRDAQYIRWRYLTFAEPGYFVVAIRKWSRLVGWSAFRVAGDSLLWGDALFDQAARDAPETLLRHVASGLPIQRIECWFPARPAWFDAQLKALRFESQPEPRDLSLSCVPFLFEGAVNAIRESLYYSMGDSDLF